MLSLRISISLFVGVFGSITFTGSAVAQPGILERLEQRVRDGLRIPGEVQESNPAGAPATTDVLPPPAEPKAEGQPAAEAVTLPPVPAIAPTTPSLRSMDESPEPVVLGLELEEIYIPGGGLLVSSVTPGSPADASGVRARDVLQMIDGRVVVKLSDVVDVLSKHRPADRIMLRLKRDGLVLETAALLGGTSRKEAPTLPNQTTEPVKENVGNGARLGADVDELIGVASDSPVQRGAVVVAVKPNSPAEAIGIQIGDVIAAVDGRLVTGVRSMVNAVAPLKPGQKAEITYFSGKEMLRKTVIMAGPEGTLPPDVLASLVAQQPNKDAATTEASSGISGWFGGLGKMFSSSKPEVVASAPAEPVAQKNEAAIASEKSKEQLLQDQVKRLEQRIAELEQQLKSSPTP